MQTEIDAKITDSEWEVMRVVWAQDTVTSKEIREILQQKMDWKPATTKTFIGRLVKKGMLHTEKEGNKFIYSANINENEFIKNNLDETFDNICNKDVGSTIVDLISKATLSFQDIENLEKALEMKKKYAVQEIPCSCVPGQCKCRDYSCSSGY
ncbi:MULTISPECIES: CopY/TcrY family copper transport repressor [Staphylococcus]|uniref:CopY/TcrY family copper transport repressor n=1 Tax=Staphylococcaceae TaxID=90964 RepID=UPI0002AD9FF9|nr:MULTISPECIES: CopY/TcrY family copper transport repressor [Staphylococcus]AGC91716.1 CopY family transcriptional regulator [Staphylococcus warneri SG1]HBO6125074.1 CopY/TcrY family copper transport repressor [Pseudomonas aeruginosa]MBF2753492.1 CopY/TcrY family copper transport repressor [Staphylococcus saprophyticus]MCG9807212.1 CopY/TcrY family copper transport repressor [Staphylococcus argenteus]MCG9812324.1 CopY/TcrY family copper transport repressor [Staphylococcus argenteus]